MGRHRFSLALLALATAVTLPAGAAYAAATPHVPRSSHATKSSHVTKSSAVVSSHAGNGRATRAALEAPASPIGDSSDCTGAGFCVPGGLLTLSENVTGDVGACSFSGTIDWGDGSSDSVGPYTSTIEVSHQYTSPGIYTVVTSISGTPVQDGATCTSDNSPLTVEVPAPIDVQIAAMATENAQPSATQRSFTFDASGTTVTPTDVTLSYSWTIPGGTTGTGVRFTTNVVCSATDQDLTASLVVHAVKGTADKSFTASVPFTIKACPAVTAAFTTALEGSTFLTTRYNFDASATTATPPGATISYNWAFGDGTSGTGETAFHAYSCILAKRKVIVTLTVTAAWPGVTLTSSATQTVKVSACTSFHVAIPPKAVNDAFTVNGTGHVTGNVLSNDSPGEDASGKPFHLRVTVRQPAHGHVTMSGAIYPAHGAGTFTYAANQGFCGIDSFAYTIGPPASTDPGLFSTATVYLYVCGSNLPRYLTGLAAQAQAAGDRQAATLLRSAAKAVQNGQMATALANVSSALSAVRTALLKLGITYAVQQLRA